MNPAQYDSIILITEAIVDQNNKALSVIVAEPAYYERIIENIDKQLSILKSINNPPCNTHPQPPGLKS